MYYTVIKHSSHLRTLEKCRKHSPAARAFHISLVFSNACRVLSQCNTRLRLYLLTNVECDGTVIKLPKTKKPIRFLNFKFSINGGDLVFWFTFNLAVDFRPKMALTLEILSDQMRTFFYLGIALSTQFSSSSLVLGGLNLDSAICFAKQRVRSELTNKLGNNVTSVDEYSKIVTAQQLDDRIMHISRLKYSS